MRARVARHRMPARSGRVPLRIVLLVGVAATVLGGVAIAATRSTDRPDFVSTLVAMHSDKCLTALDTTRRNGSGLVQQACASAPTQRFEFRDRGGYEIRNVETGYCVDVRGGAWSDGVRLIQWAECGEQANQRFMLRPVPGFSDAFLVVAAHSGKCLDVKSGDQGDGASVVQWACGDTATAGNQVWRVRLPFGTAPPALAPSAPGAGAVAAAQTSPGRRQSRAAAPSASGEAAGPPAPTGQNQDWGRAVPPSGAPLSRAYLSIVGDGQLGYTPRAGECSREIHARYWAWGPDGKVYPTWHPPRDPSGCSFGHEHGADPRTTTLFTEVGWIPFGYANEQLAPSEPARQRDEDHVGHKIGGGNDIKVHATPDDDSPVIGTCDALMMMHQGLHSPDAFTNNLHQLAYNVRCSYTDGQVVEARFTALLPIGHARGFAVTEQCATDNNLRHDEIGPASPRDSPSGVGERFIADAVCASDIVAGNGDVSRINEIWTYGVTTRNTGQLARFEIMTFMFSANPARYFDPQAPERMSYTVDLCAKGAKGFQCDQVRRLAEQAGKPIAFDDPRSPFNGAIRLFSPNRLVVQNTGPTTLYTDVLGKRFSPTPFPGAIRQYIAGNRSFNQREGVMSLPLRNYGSNPDDGVHAPN